MAKTNKPVGDDDESRSLAERLFVANFLLSSGYTAESVAAKCIEAAEAFEKVRRDRIES